MRARKKPETGSKDIGNRPVLVLHGLADAQWPAWAATMARDGLDIYCRSKLKGARPLKHGPSSLSEFCAELEESAPDCPVIVVRAPLEFSPSLFAELEHTLSSADGPVALTALSNAHSDLNPFAELSLASLRTESPSKLIAALAERRIHEIRRWPSHFVALSAAAIRKLAGTGHNVDAAGRFLRSEGGGILAPEWWFISDPEQPLTLSARRDPHEKPRPVAWGGLRDRLDQWLAGSDITCPTFKQEPATLHITHSWGGGVEVWIRNFIHSCPDELHLQLRSEGPQSGQGAGQKLALYAGNELRCPIDSWWLQPPIEAIDASNAQYREVLERIGQRFSLSRVMISSLIGHSLDALRQDLPTVQILHDHFPAWPLLSIHPREYDSDLGAALSDLRADEQFQQPGGEDWQNLADQYRSDATHISLAAPSRSVIDVQRSLHPGWRDIPIELIPHGLPALPGARTIKPRPRKDERLRLLIPGRVQSGKGADILEKALPELNKIAQVYLLGTGKGGERFFGHQGVHVVLEYQPEQLASLVSAIGPQVAALLSIVPETFSYTLSEMKALSVPVIATRLGSFAERIEHGKDGWLIEPTAEQLVSQLRQLAEQPAQLKKARSVLDRQQPVEMQEMISQYNSLCPPLTDYALPEAVRAQNLAEAQLNSLSDQLQRGRERLRTAREEQQQLQKMVEKRTQWALSEQRQREQWVGSLQDELQDLRKQLESSNRQLDDLHEELAQRAGHVEKLDDELNATLSELSTTVTASDELRESLEQRRRHIDKLDQEIEAQASELCEVVAQGDELREELESRTRHIRELDQELEARGRELRETMTQSDELRSELQTRAEHIQSLDKELQTRAEHIQSLDKELQTRAEHISSLDTELADQREAFDTLQQDNAALRTELEHASSSLATLEQQIQQTREQMEEQRLDFERQRDQFQSRYEEMTSAYDTILASHSWRLTKPLRASRRVLDNFFRVRAWNPLRWPLLLSQTIRIIATHGAGGALERMQYGRPQHHGSAPSTRRVETTRPGPDFDLPERLPVSDKPVISVIIPVYNHLDHTAVCLQSLAQAQCETPFEVVLVDDASSDQSEALLPAIEGLRYQRNAENMGFIHTCNNGAANARGEYVLFLNNDTEVQDGWLDQLLEVFEQRADAGLVGARLIYPDGSLQECGGMIFSDGSGWNYGRGDDADKPEYQYLREVDYCSGACLMLSSSLYRQLGGFDTHYAPAYYEDTDLAFKVREAGLKVYVQPAATVVHYEGVSSGTDITSGTKRYQEVNRNKFLQRWQSALDLQPPPIHDPDDLAVVRASRDHRLRGQVLVVDAYTPEPDQDSGSVRLTYLMRCLLDLGYGVTFFPDNRAWAGRYTKALQNMGVQSWYDPWLGSSESFLERQGGDFDCVIVSRHYIATHYLAPVRKYAPDAKFIFDTVDLHYLREQRHAELENSTVLRQTAKQTRRSELAVVRDADATLVVSPVEVEVLGKDAPEADVYVLSNIHEVHGRNAGFAERKDLYFVGGYQHPPNIDAVEWFVREIWPLAHPQLPGVTFHIVGSKAPDSLRDMAGEYADQAVRFHGFVRELDPFLDGCRLSVAPLRYGAGVKGKVNQSMSHGQPVVATAVAMEGLHAEDGRDALIADEAEDFAAAVVRLYNDQELWERLSEHGLSNVQAHFSLEAASQAIADMFDALQA